MFIILLGIQQKKIDDSTVKRGIMHKFKFIGNTAKTFINRRKPYFVHLCVTEQCNLRCCYCQIWGNPCSEVSTSDFKKIIDKLVRMGIVILVFTGGEPLLRSDIFELIDYAAEKGLVTSISSNGTMSRKKYSDLLLTGIEKISISLDSIEGKDILYSHTGKKILENIKFLSHHKEEKVLTVSTTLFEGNQDSILEVIEYCKKNRIMIFLQPVVTGYGDLRREGNKVEPCSIKSPNVLNPKFFNKACEEYARAGALKWNCLGGQLFFDIKPNGDFWICQDYPTTLNILDPYFEDKFRDYDFKSAREQCKEGCIYSCYYLTQKAFEIDKIYPMIKMMNMFNKSRKLCLKNEKEISAP